MIVYFCLELTISISQELIFRSKCILGSYDLNKYSVVQSSRLTRTGSAVLSKRRMFTLSILLGLLFQWVTGCVPSLTQESSWLLSHWAEILLVFFTLLLGAQGWIIMGELLLVTDNLWTTCLLTPSLNSFPCATLLLA